MNDGKSKMQAETRRELDSTKIKKKNHVVHDLDVHWHEVDSTKIDSDLTLHSPISRISTARGERGTSGVCSTTTRAKRGAETEPKQFSTLYQRCTCCAVSVGMNTRHISDERGRPLCFASPSEFECGVMFSEFGSTEKGITKNRERHPMQVNLLEQPEHRIKIMRQSNAAMDCHAARAIKTRNGEE
jgi:hypothetical protein